MNIVTLTTDFGTKDYYVGLLKGSILSHGEPVVWADITHHIENFNIVQAAFVVKNCYKSFPKETIHIVSVNNFYADQRKFLAIYHKGHYFIGPDNGTFSLLFDEDKLEYVYELPDNGKSHTTLGVKQMFATAVAHILKNRPFHEIGMPKNDILQRIALQAITGKNHIRGSIVHIDNYGNALSNITKELFDRVSKGRPFELYFKRHDPITIISEHYAETPVGEQLALFNAANYLEIAVNMGQAATLYGLQIGDTIQIDFFDD